jgi:hypothetical protein
MTEVVTTLLASLSVTVFPRPRIRCVPRIVAFDRLQRANGGEKNPPW